jgi:hypothetical protein
MIKINEKNEKKRNISPINIKGIKIKPIIKKKIIIKIDENGLTRC